MHNAALLTEIGRSGRPVPIKRGLAATLDELLSLAAVAAGADGLIVEVHPSPDEAVCDGDQSLTTDAFGAYAERVLSLAATIREGAPLAQAA
jgi:3-deoxy-7-phosphoheptulonate synthase